MSSPSLVAPAFVTLIEKLVMSAISANTRKGSFDLSAGNESLEPKPLVSGSIPMEFQDSVNRATELTESFDKTNVIQYSNQAVLILESLLNRIGETHPDRHYALFHLALVLCRRVEIQVSRKCIEPLLVLHRILSRCVFLARQAVSITPPGLDTKIEYLGQLGHTVTLWSTALSCCWTEKDVLDLVAEMKADHNTPSEEKISGFVSAALMASALSTAFGVTQNSKYREEGRAVYRYTLKSMRDVLPLDVLFKPPSAPTAKKAGLDFLATLKVLRAFNFIKEDLIPFIVQIMAVLVQRLVEAPVSAILGRRLAAIAVEKGAIPYGVEWLEQCLMLVWGQQNLHAPTPLDTSHAQGDSANTQGRMSQVILAFLGLCVYVDIVADGHASILHPEELACSLMNEWLKLRGNDPALTSLFTPPSFDYLLRSARTAPVVVLNLWGTQCDALILFGNGNFEHVPLKDVTEDLAAKLQKQFRGGLDCSYLRSGGNEKIEVRPGAVDAGELRGLSPAPVLSMMNRILGILWTRIVKPLFEAMDLKPVESAASDPPCLTWFPTGPTAFFPLHAAGQYNTKEKGSKTYHYVASSYTPTLSVLADASNSLCHEPEPFKGILAVSQPYALGQTPIPKTVDEVKALMKAVDHMVPLQWLNEDQATKEAVLRGMQTSTWVHLACHAQQYPLNTSESAFMLGNGDKLSLADISAHPHADGELAFLSACQTAAGDFDLSEEGVHLASGMLFAGYRGVIATSWSVRDEDAPVVAEEVYRRLLEGRKVKRSGSALALHHATQLLRDNVGEDQIFRWAPFTHFGI